MDRPRSRQLLTASSGLSINQERDTMQLSFAAPHAIDSGAWIVGALEGGVLSNTAQKADKAAGGAIRRGLKVSSFTGKAGQALEILAPASVRASRILLVGMGKAAEFDGTKAENLAASINGRLSGAGETEVTFEIDVPKGAKLKAGELAAHLALGARLRGYVFNQYRTKNLDEHEFKLKKVTIVTNALSEAKKNWAHLEGIAAGIVTARDLINEPPNVLHPEEFARRARTLLGRLGVKVDILGEAVMK
jgi:leucyl aminopeptidase